MFFIIKIGSVVSKVGKEFEKYVWLTLMAKAIHWC